MKRYPPNLVKQQNRFRDDLHEALLVHPISPGQLKIEELPVKKKMSLWAGMKEKDS